MGSTNRLPAPQAREFLPPTRDDIIQAGKAVHDKILGHVKELAKRVDSLAAVPVDVEEFRREVKTLADLVRPLLVSVKEIETAVYASKAAEVIATKRLDDVLVAHGKSRAEDEARYAEEFQALKESHAKALGDLEASTKAFGEMRESHAREMESLREENKALGERVKQYQEQTGFVLQAYQQGMDSIRKLVENLEIRPPAINVQLPEVTAPPVNVQVPEKAIVLEMPDRVKTFKYLDDGRPDTVSETSVRKE